jgi:hypothetical protein
LMAKLKVRQNPSTLQTSTAPKGLELLARQQVMPLEVLLVLQGM